MRCADGPRGPPGGHFRHQKSVAKTVQRLGGFVAKYMGDGVLVYFGYPEAHEDDAERALKSLVVSFNQFERIG